MTTLHLVRHGETTWGVEGRYVGSSDVPLSERGEQQALRLGEWARTAGLTRILASDLSRAQRTAAAAAAATGLAVETEPRVREVGFGVAEGLTNAEQLERFAEALAAFDAHPATMPLPGGERGESAVARILGALRDIVAEDPDGVVLVVCHTTVIRLALSALLGLPLDDYRRTFPAIDNVAITSLRLRPVADDPIGDVAVLRVNALPWA